MGFSTLARGLIGQITSRFSIWTNQMNQNLRFLDTRFGGLKVLEQIATTASLPANPNDGDSYVITSTKTVETWFSTPGTWQPTQLYVPDIFWDVDQAKFYYYDGTNIVELLTASLPAPNYDISDSSGNFSTTSSTPVSVTNLDVTITSSGNPIDVFFVGDGSNNQARFGIRNTTSVGTEAKGYIDLKRDGIVIQTLPLYLMSGVDTGSTMWLQIPPSFRIKDVLPSGTYNYTVESYIDSAVDPDQVIEIFFCKLVAQETR